jgi:hypothetical protein
VVIHRTASDAGALDDLLAASARVSSLGKQRAGGVDQRAARPLTALRLRARRRDSFCVRRLLDDNRLLV